ncbi:MAG: hypothetical protein IKP28_04780 [Clostridia bacterium]|nr:hypothetical protein [Clostridia bacterium]
MTSLNELIRRSFLCEEGMLFHDKKVIHIHRLVRPQGLYMVYCTKDGVLAFFDESGNLYITKWSDEKNRILENNGFQRKGFDVPFTKGERPCDTYLCIRLDWAMENY